MTTAEASLNGSSLEFCIISAHNVLCETQSACVAYAKPSAKASMQALNQRLQVASAFIS